MKAAREIFSDIAHGVTNARVAQRMSGAPASLWNGSHRHDL